MVEEDGRFWLGAKSLPRTRKRLEALGRALIGSSLETPIPTVASWSHQDLSLVPGLPPPPPLPPPLHPPLRPLLHIEWSLLPPLPIGVEDNDGGFVDDETLVVSFGLSGHSYPGCVNSSWAINVTASSSQKWKPLPNAPASSRQVRARVC